MFVVLCLGYSLVNCAAEPDNVSVLNAAPQPIVMAQLQPQGAPHHVLSCIKQTYGKAQQTYCSTRKDTIGCALLTGIAGGMVAAVGSAMIAVCITCGH